MRPIDVDALIETMYENAEGNEGWYGDTWQFMRDIENAPTIDAVPVVRCKDCRWWTKQEKSIQGRCALNGTYPTGGWYCANGERKDNE